MAETAFAYIFKVVASNAIRMGASKAAATLLAKSAVFAAKVGLTVGASAALNAAFAPRVSTPDSRIAQRQSTPERAAAFGRVRSAGAYSLYSTSDADSIDVLAFHDGRIAGIDQIYLHDDPVTLGTGPLGAGFVQGDSRTGQYFEAIYIDTRLGTANQSAFTRAAGKVPGEWSSQHCMDGVAALELLCLGPKKERLPKVYPLGLPRPSVVYRAQYCFDFRQSGQSVENWRGWTPGSRNPVLQMATYMCNPAVPDPVEPDRALGLGMDFEAEIAPHLDAWIAAANACDQLVPKKGGGTEPRYQCDFEYYVGEEPADTIARFLASCDGWLSETGDGALTIKVGAYDGSAAEINSDWVIGHAVNRGVPDEQLKNVFVGFYTDPDKKFSQVEGAPWYDQGSIALTGKRRYERVPMTQVQSHGQLTRLLKRIALRRNAEARGTLRLSLPALDLMGERWLKFPADFPNSEFLRGKIVEVEALEIDFSDGGAVILDWAIYDTDADVFDPDSEEGAAPPAPSESELSAPPVIDAGDVSADVDTESRFGGQRQAVAVLTFPAPVRSYDIAGAGSVDVPRTDLGWRVRWRIRPDGGWTESAISGDVIEGDEVEGWTVRLRTPDLPRAALDIQIAAVGPRDDQGDWSDSVPVDVEAATAPALAAPANVTATAALEESEGGVKRPALTVSFDPITSPEAQMVLVAIKPAGDPDSSFAQIDAIEPRLGGKTIYTIPYGRTVDVGLQTWAQWREPSAWAVVEGVVIPGELSATDISGKTRSQIEADFAEARRAAREAGEALIFETTDRYYRIRKVTTLARNLFETERTERTEALLAEAQTRTAQFSAVNLSIAGVETTVTTLATDLTAEANTRTIQFSALEDNIAAVETGISTVASDLATETSVRQTQASLFEDNFATLTNQYSTLADAQGAQGEALTSIQVSVNAQGVTLSSLSTDYTTLSASVDLLYSARIFQVSAGDATATIGIYAEDQNGNAAAEVFLGGNTIWMNETVRFRSDGQLTFFHYDGSIALNYAPWSGNMEIFKPDGTLQWNSTGGGATTEGIIERAATAPNAAPTTTFGPWAVGEHNALGNVRGWALQHLSVTLDDAIGGARCAIDWDYDFSFQGKAAQFFTWWERVYLLPVSAGLPGYRQSYGLQNSRLCEQGAGNVNNDSISPTAINANKWLAFPRGGSKNIILPSDAGTVPYRVVLQLCLDRDEIDHSSGNQNGILNPNGSLQYAFESCDISATVFKR